MDGDAEEKVEKDGVGTATAKMIEKSPTRVHYCPFSALACRPLPCSRTCSHA